MLAAAIRGQSQQAANGYRREAEPNHELAETQATSRTTASTPTTGRSKPVFALADTYRKIATSREREVAELDAAASYAFGWLHHSKM